MGHNAKPINRVTRLFASIIAYGFYFLVIVFIVLLLCARGATLKYPLQEYLSDYLGQKISIGKMKYSIFYPNTVSLHDVQINDDLIIDELYAEISLVDLYYQPKVVHFHELDIIQPQLTPKTEAWLQTLPTLQIDKLWIKDAHIAQTSFSYSTENLTIQQAVPELPDLILQHKGSLVLSNGQLFAEQVQNGSINFDCDEKSCDLDYAIFFPIGNLSGQAKVDKTTLTITTANLKVNGLKITPPTHYVGYNLLIPDLLAENTSLHTEAWQLDAFTGKITQPLTPNQAIDGTFSALKIGDYDLSDGTLDSKAYLGGRTTYNIQATYQDSLVDITFDTSDDYIDISNLTLTNFHYNAQKNWQQTDFNFTKNIHISALQCNECTLVSYNQEFPLTMRKINLQASELNYLDNTWSIGNFSLTDGAIAYDEYVFIDNTFQGTLTDNIWHIENKQAVFDNSTAYLELQYPQLSDGVFTLNLRSEHLNLADLHVSYTKDLSGITTAELSLQASLNKAQQWQIDHSTIYLASDAITVDGFSMEQFVTKLTPQMNWFALQNAYQTSLTAIVEFTNLRTVIHYFPNTFHWQLQANSMFGAIDSNFFHDSTPNHEALVGNITVTNNQETKKTILVSNYAPSIQQVHSTSEKQETLTPKW